MIIVTIGGGLGNQMYQYAFYKKLKKIYPHISIKLDILHTFGQSHNGYEIKKIFGLDTEECSIKELISLSEFYPKDGRNYNLHEFINKIKRKLGISKKTFIVQEDYTEFYEKFFHLDGEKSYCLMGAFANAKYFSDIEDEIREMYVFPTLRDKENLQWQDKILNSQSVGIHIRRGDFAKYGIEMASEEYYRKAIKYINHELRGNCHYFVFTNDPEYVNNEYSDISNLEIISCNKGENSYKDMQLMSMCKHNIIANSSFSFWGAYLNKNPNKIVIVPNLPYTGCKNIFMCDDWLVL
jgi:hypothetical protein